MAWFNSDGLLVKFGLEEGAAGKGGAFRDLGPNRMYEWKLTLTDYPFGATIYVIDDTCFIPKAFMDSVEVEVLTGATGATATLDFGLQRTDRTTEIDYDGLLAAVAQTVIDTPAGKTRLYRSEATDSIPVPAVGGALLGTTTTNVGLPVVRVNTASFTAGVIAVRLFVRPV